MALAVNKGSEWLRAVAAISASATFRPLGGLANGGTTCEEPPGFRDGAVGRLYRAYLRDPDGNKICALHRPAK